MVVTTEGAGTADTAVAAMVTDVMAIETMASIYGYVLAIADVVTATEIVADINRPVK